MNWSRCPSMIFAVSIAALAVNLVSARLCVFGTEPDPSAGRRVRAVVPPGDPCTCTELVLGGHNIYPPPRPVPPIYVDIAKLLAEGVNGILQLFNCPANELVSFGTTQELATVAGKVTHEHLTVATTSAVDCQGVLDAGYTTNGVYTIYPSAEPMQVYCSMESGLGYIVFQRRMNGLESFYRSWQEYADGFGDMEGEFWLGNEKLRDLTSSQDAWDLVITLHNFAGEVAHAAYHEFTVQGDAFTLGVGDFFNVVNGGINAGESLEVHSGRPFSTYDNDAPGNIAENLQSGWWFTASLNKQECTLNGEYSDSEEVQEFRGILWEKWGGMESSLKGCEMKMRRSSALN